MRDKLGKAETAKVLNDGRVLWGVVLLKGDTLYTYAFDMLEAYRNIFGESPFAAASVRGILRLDGNLTF